jgi:hypothetical protein
VDVDVDVDVECAKLSEPSGDSTRAQAEDLRRMGMWRTAMTVPLLASLLRCSGDPSGQDPTIPFVRDLGLDKLFGSTAQPFVVSDEELTVAARAWRGPGFTLPSSRSVHLIVEGKQHTDKGFRVYVMAPEEVARFEKRKPFKDVPAFEGLKVHTFDKTGTLPAGSWCVVVHNSENVLQPMVAHLRVVVNPP